MVATACPTASAPTSGETRAVPRRRPAVEVPGQRDGQAPGRASRRAPQPAPGRQPVCVCPGRRRLAGVPALASSRPRPTKRRPPPTAAYCRDGPDVNRRTRSQENLNSQWSLGLSREMQRPPARVVDCLHGGASGQEHLQAIHVPISSRIVHRRPPQPIPTRHADHPQPA
ncbi:hypothetical protein SCOCK_70150 [Actinacidiphila cocklensis]|uniref:Uncharacterized protein n=1 Tax=Actinacidiphila cocklensis TaxID=887465 RepID=A0A9W4DYG3_9ACTN|nr:hypothetical protein SCOCK_70150 [Actinacidiphila cocklensis]